jgi:dienelactone hydrolase
MEGNAIMRWVLIFIVLLAGWSPRSSAAEDRPSLPVLLQALLAPPLAGFSGLIEETAPTQATIGGASLALETFATRPDRPGRYPVALIIHGAELRRAEIDRSLRQWATTLASRGWLAVAIDWSGYYTSDGSADLNTGSCDRPEAGAWLDRQSETIEAAARALAARDDADPSPVLLFGVSEGGLIALNTAARGAIPVAAAIVASSTLRAWNEESGPVRCAAFDADVATRVRQMGRIVRALTL